jgi:hypothetical protein
MTNKPAAKLLGRQVYLFPKTAYISAAALLILMHQKDMIRCSNGKGNGRQCGISCPKGGDDTVIGDIKVGKPVNQAIPVRDRCGRVIAHSACSGTMLQVPSGNLAKEILSIYGTDPCCDGKKAYFIHHLPHDIAILFRKRKMDLHFGNPIFVFFVLLQRNPVLIAPFYRPECQNVNCQFLC